MNILISNDDGYNAAGITVLEETLRKWGHYVMVVAPTEEQSGKSHAMTIARSIELIEYGENHYAMAGTPADCVIYSVRANILSRVPDLIVSGINHGYNQSLDIVYSGTCAAARQASIFGYRAIALSAETGEEGNLRDAAEFLAQNIDLSLRIPPGTFMNINVPKDFNGGMEYSGMGHVSYDDKVAVVYEGNRTKKLMIVGAEVRKTESESSLPSDHSVCKRGLASVSVIDNLPRVLSVNEITL